MGRVLQHRKSVHKSPAKAPSIFSLTSSSFLKKVAANTSLDCLRDLNLISTKSAKKVEAHSLVIFQQIPKLQSKAQKLAKQNVIEINVSGELLQQLCDLCYGGTIGPISGASEMMDLIEFARDYEVDELKEYCNENFKKLITIDNCCTILDRCPAAMDEIYAQCIDFIASNFWEVGQTEAFVSITAAAFSAVLRCDEHLFVSEEDVLLIFLKWLYKLPNFTFKSKTLPYNKAPEIKELLYEIRFPLISFRLFAQHVESILADFKCDDLILEYFKWQAVKKCELRKTIENKRMVHRKQRLLNIDELLNMEVMPYPFISTGSGGHQWIAIQNKFPSNKIPRCGTYVQIDDDNILVTGGMENKNNSSAVSRLNLCTIKSYEMPNLLLSRVNHAATAYYGSVWVAGGTNISSYLDSVEQYDAERDTWIALPRMLQRRAYFQLIRSDGNLYAIGGIAENLLNNVEFYDGTRWQETSPMQTNRAGFGAAVYQNYIYALGGFIKSGKVYEDTDVVERFDMNTKKWTKVASLKLGRRHVSAVVFYGKLYAIGGFHGGMHQNIVEMYDAENDIWEEVSHLNGKCGTSASFVVPDYIDKFQVMAVLPPTPNPALKLQLQKKCNWSVS